MNSTVYDSRVDFSSRQDFRDDLTFFDEQSRILEEECPNRETVDKKIQRDEANFRMLVDEANQVKLRLLTFNQELIETSKEMLQEVKESTQELKELDEDVSSKSTEVATLEKLVRSISEDLEDEKQKTTMINLLQSEYKDMGELFKAKAEALNKLKVKEATAVSDVDRLQLLEALKASTIF